MASEPNLVTRRKRHWLAGVSFVVIAGAALFFWLWDWNWFSPIVAARLSAAMGRAVTIDRLEVHPGRVTEVIVYGVKAANPPGFEEPNSATIQRVAVDFAAETWLRSRRIVLPLIELDQPNVTYVQGENGKSNWDFSGPSSSPPPEIGDLRIQGGIAHIRMAREKADATLNISTEGQTLIVNGKGTYARQPISVQAKGGAVLALRDASSPYPIDLQLENGETRITLKGHISDPLSLKGADLNLALSGPDMALLLPLTGIAVPQTPPYSVSGRLDFEDGRVKFTNVSGRVGSSDINGDLAVTPSSGRPTLTADLLSHRVDMQDLGGFVGATPGRTTTPGQSSEQVYEVKRAEESSKLLPATPISIPKILAANVHLTYRGEKILGKNVPFDSIRAKLDIDDGHIRLSPISLGIGKGTISGNIALTPDSADVDADVDIKAEHVDISRLLASAGLGSGEGELDGTARVKGRGASLSAILGNGNGAIRLVMPLGGEINSLLVDLSGVEFGPAFLAAIGIPNKEGIRCMVTDFVLQQGILASRALEVDTTEHVISGGGRVDLSREIVEMTLRTDPKHFTIGKLATPVVISGQLKHLHFAPDKELAIRGGVAAALGVLFPPAAILPTIQFGVGDSSPCAEAKAQ